MRPACELRSWSAGKLVIVVAVFAGLFCGCAPNSRAVHEAIVRNGRGKPVELIQTEEFDIREAVVYPPAVSGKPSDDVDTVSWKTLARYRCTWCHDCGFKTAWDYAHFRIAGWNPKYRGAAWRPVVERMRSKEGAMLNDELAQRIADYLRDESLGKLPPGYSDLGTL
jgi:hypothetical protein